MGKKLQEEEIAKPSFPSFYNTDLLPVLRELEQERKDIKNTLIYPTAGLGSVAILLIIFVQTAGIQSLVLTAITGTGVWVWFKTKASREYRAKFKSKVVGKIIRYINPEYRYSPYGRMDKNEFVSTGIFNRTPDRYQGEDLISGVNDQTEFSFSEVTAQYYVQDSKGRRSLRTLFKGLMFKADFHKDFKTRTVIRSDIGEKYLGNIGKMFQKLNFTRTGLTEMENVDFEKEFVVYSDDSLEARYILSPSFMEKLMACKKRLDVEISLSFYKSNIYIAIPISKDFFEPRLFRTIIDQEKTEEYFEDMKMVLEIIDELNLNTRIWSKVPKFEEEEKNPKSHMRRGFRR